LIFISGFLPKKLTFSILFTNHKMGEKGKLIATRQKYIKGKLKVDNQEYNLKPSLIFFYSSLNSESRYDEVGRDF